MVKSILKLILGILIYTSLLNYSNVKIRRYNTDIGKRNEFHSNVIYIRAIRNLISFVERNDTVQLVCSQGNIFCIGQRCMRSKVNRVWCLVLGINNCKYVQTLSVFLQVMLSFYIFNAQ